MGLSLGVFLFAEMQGFGIGASQYGPILLACIARERLWIRVCPLLYGVFGGRTSTYFQDNLCADKLMLFLSDFSMLLFYIRSPHSIL